MQTRRWKTNNHVSGFDSRTINHFIFFDNTDDGADQVVIFAVIDAGHLRGFAADERAARFAAAGDKTRNNLQKGIRVQLAHTYIIEEEKRFCAKHRDIVDTVIHQILPDGVVPIRHHGNFELGTDSIHAADKHGFFIPREARIKKSAESANGYYDYGVTVALLLKVVL